MVVVVGSGFGGGCDAFELHCKTLFFQILYVWQDEPLENTGFFKDFICVCMKSITKPSFIKMLYVVHEKTLQTTAFLKILYAVHEKKVTKPRFSRLFLEKSRNPITFPRFSKFFQYFKRYRCATIVT